MSIAPGVRASGEIKRASPFEEVKGFKTMRKGKIVNDYMLDDQALFVAKNKGLVVITGCAQAGLINTVNE